MAELKSRVVEVLITDTQVSPKKSRNGFLQIENKDGTNPVEITFGEQAAVVGEGILLIAGAKFNTNYPGSGEIRGIATAGTVNISVTD